MYTQLVHLTVQQKQHNSVNQLYSNMKAEKDLSPPFPLSSLPAALPPTFSCFSAIIKKKPSDHTRGEAGCLQASLEDSSDQNPYSWHPDLRLPTPAS